LPRGERERLRTILYKLSDLRTGDSIGEVYFRLGSPNKVEGNTYIWFDGKPDPVAFSAFIENGVLTSVNCL
jgi:hypothetical protein